MHGMNRKTTILALALALACAVAATAGPPGETWNQWGGPTRDFQAPSTGLADSWPEGGPPKLWSRELGDGYSTILAADGRLYTMYRKDDKETVVCLDAKNGETVWETRYDHEPWKGHVTDFGKGPRATPLLAGDRLFTVGVAGRMSSLRLSDGKILWTKELWGEGEGDPLIHGYASSPVAYGDTVIALVGTARVKITAFRQEDGAVVWQSESYGNTYSAPQVLTVGGQDQLVTFMDGELVAVDPTSGGPLWSYKIGSQSNINMPIFIDGEYLFLSTLQDGARGLRVHRQDGKTEVEEVWSTRKIQFFHVTSVHQGDWVYGITGARAPHFLAAVNAKTGEIAWRERGFAKGNVVAADGRLIVLDETGKLYLATATPEGLTVHSEADLLEQVAWTAPTLVGTTMYLRDKTQIMALDLGKPKMTAKKESSS